MDLIVTASEDGNEWSLTDLLGRSMGCVVTTAERQLVVEPSGVALETMAGMSRGTFRSLDEAIAAIETHTRSACRRVGGEDAA